MMSFAHSVLARLLHSVARGVCRHPRAVIYPQIILAAVCVLLSSLALRLDTDRNHLVGDKNKSQQVYLQFHKEFPGEDEMIAVVESESPERNRQFIERLGPRLRKDADVFTDTFYKGDLAALGPKALWLVPTNDLVAMAAQLREFRPFIQEFAQATNLDGVFRLINNEFRTAPEEENQSTKALVNAIPFLQQVVTQATFDLSFSGRPVSPGFEAFFGGSEAAQEMYVTLDHGRFYLLTTRAKSAALTERAIARLRQRLREVQAEVPGVNVGLTGEPVLDYDEMLQSQHDSMVASVVALALCSLIFIVAYHEAARPLKAAVCLTVGLAYALGFATVAVGHLNILTITFAPILIGLAIDFGVHFTSRYEEEMRRGSTEEGAVHTAMVFTGQGIVSGAFTMAAAFLAMALTNFKGIREMGTIAGGGLLVCLIPMITLLPLWLMHGKQNVRDKERGPAGAKRMRIENLWLGHPRRVLAGALVVCVVAAVPIYRVHFDYDLLHMQSSGLASVVYEQRLIQRAGKSLLYAAVMADSVPQAVDYEERLKRLPGVASVESVASYVTQDPAQKSRLISAIRNEVGGLYFPPVDLRPVDTNELSRTMWILAGYTGLAAADAQKQAPAVARQLRALRGSIIEFRTALDRGEPHIQEQLTLFQQALLREFRQTFHALERQDAHPVTPATLPPVLHQRFVGVTGKLLLQVYPKADVWDHANQQEFLRQLRSVIPADRITGSPVTLYEYTTLLKNSYEQAGWYALAAISLMLYIHFHRWSCALLSLLPVGIGFVWLLGFMGATGLPFNPANIMTLPLVVGIGVSNGLQILNRFAEEQKPGVLAKSTGKAVVVSGLTAMAGFGSLILAQHRGIRSLGIIMTLGIGACMIAGLTFLPALIQVLWRRGWRIPVEHSEREVATDASTVYAESGKQL